MKRLPLKESAFIGILLTATMLGGGTIVSIAQTNELELNKVSDVKVDIIELQNLVAVDSKEIKKVEIKDSWYIEELDKTYGLTKKKQEFIYDTAKDFGLEYELVLSFAKVESNYDVKCETVSESDDVGLFQVNKFWIKSMSEKYNRKIDLHDFEDNTIVACDIIAQCFKDWGKYKDDQHKYFLLSVNSYNAGTRNIKKHFVSRGENIRSREYGQLIEDTYNAYLKGEWNFEPRD